MYVIIDWTMFSFVVEEGSDSIQVWESNEEAQKYAEENLHSGLWKVLPVPPFARPFKP